MNNKVILKFDSKSENEQLARACISAIMLPINPSISELGDVKTAVSEAVTNAIVHGYPDNVGVVEMEVELSKEQIHIIVMNLLPLRRNCQKLLATMIPR
jgi:stage II sporulation protein AB (anti-sigma F factor)